MPLYEYECDTCGHRVEKIQKFSDPPLETCEKCGGPVHKMQAAPAVQCKGTGWDVSDYAKSGNAGTEEKKDEKKAEPASSTASTTTSPTAGETKSKD